MAIAYKINNVEDASLQSSYNGITTVYQAVRVATVKNLDDGSQTADATALARALLFVQQKFPPYTPYGGGIANCVVMGHQVIPVSQSDDAVRVKIVYGTPDINHNSIFVVSDTTSTQSDTTQIYRNDVTKQIEQLYIDYVDPANRTIFKKWIGSTRLDRTLRSTCLDVILPKANLPKFRPYVNTVNDKPFNGLPAGFWKVDDFTTTTEDLGMTFKIQVRLNADTERDWSRYDFLRDRNTGQVVRVDQFLLNLIQGVPYQPGVIRSNGFLRVCHYATRPFASIFGNLNT